MISAFTGCVIAFSVPVFMLVKAINRLKRETPAEAAPAPATKECRYCLSSVPLKASRCPCCTSQLD